MRQFYQKVNQLLEQNHSNFAICSVIETKGSTPRKSGKMLVYADGRSEFTIGGGPAEKATVDAALEAIRNGRSAVFEWVLNKGQVGGLNAECGGQMKVWIDVCTVRPQLVLVGAGHVNFAIAALAEGLGFDVLVIDDRASTLEDDRFSFAQEIVVESQIFDAVKKAAKFIKDNAYIVVATKDDDGGALSALNGFKCPYIGLIGSQRKILKIRERLIDEGASVQWLDSIHMPIGLKIGAETPEELAISVWAEILSVKNK